MSTLIKKFLNELPQGDNCEVKAIINGDRDILLYRDNIIGIDNNINIMKIPQDATVQVVDASACKVTTGLVDTHIHGGYGCYFNICHDEELYALLLKLPRHGVTSIFPTVMTASEEEMITAIRTLKRASKFAPKGACRIEGIHLEGPYLSTKYAGVHPKLYIKAPSIKHFEQFEDEMIKVVTMAPELDKDKEFIEYLKSKGITVSAGHSEATPENMEGIYNVTHLFNAMPPMNHRTPTMTSDALFRDDVNVEVIADGVHIDKETLKLVFKIKKDSSIMLISDCLPLAYSQSTSARFASERVHIRNNRALNADGTLAGCLKFLDDIGEQLIKDELITFQQFIQFASSNPIRVYNLPYKIEVGSKADLVLWRFNKPYKAIVGGELIDIQ